jgi:hypothetical protein
MILIILQIVLGALILGSAIGLFALFNEHPFMIVVIGMALIICWVIGAYTLPLLKPFFKECLTVSIEIIKFIKEV